MGGGRATSTADAQIAATALRHNLALATRNGKDFKGIAGLAVANPWACVVSCRRSTPSTATTPAGWSAGPSACRCPTRPPGLAGVAAGRVRNARQALQKHKGKQASPFRRYCDRFRWDGHGLRPANCIANFCQTL